MNARISIQSPNVWKSTEGLVYSIVYAPNNGPDLQGDWIGRKALRDCAHNYLEYGEVRLNHQERLSPDRAKVVESYVTEEDTRIHNRLVKAGSWVAVFKLLDPDLIEMVRKGKLRGVSLAGIGKRMDSGELYECSINEISLVDSPASGIPFIAMKSNGDIDLEHPAVIQQLRALQTVVDGMKEDLQDKEQAEARAERRRAEQRHSWMLENSEEYWRNNQAREKYLNDQREDGRVYENQKAMDEGVPRPDPRTYRPQSDYGK